MIKPLRVAQFYLKMTFVAIWCSLVSFFFFLLTFPFKNKKWLSWAFANTLNFGTRLSLGIRIKVLGKENMIAGPAVIIMNHQSNFDPLLQGPVFPKNAVIIGKKEIVKIPMWGRLFDATNNIMVDRTSQGKNGSAIELAVERLTKDDCYVWIFPEGTRSQGKKMKRFKAGAFKMAIEAQVPIIPMVTKPLQYVLDVPKKIAKGGLQEMKILPPIVTKGMTLDDLNTLLSRCEEIYQQEISNYLDCSPEQVFESVSTK